jgi:hypothetical protein
MDVRQQSQYCDRMSMLGMGRVRLKKEGGNLSNIEWAL